MWAARRLRCAPAQRAKRTACAFWRRGTLRARSSMGRLPPSIAGLLVEIDHGVQDRNLNARRTRRGRQSSTRLVRGCRAPARSGSLARRSTYPSAWPAALAARGLSSTIVCDSEGMPVSARVAPPRRWRASVGRCRLGWCSASAATRGPRAVVERLQRYFESNFEPGRSFANQLYFQDALDRRYDERANVRFHRTLRCRAVDRLAEASRDVRSRQPIVEPTRRQA